MKYGVPTLEQESNTSLTKQPKAMITKSLEELLSDVFKENYPDFRAYLEQNNITVLDLSEKVRNQTLNTEVGQRGC